MECHAGKFFRDLGLGSAFEGQSQHAFDQLKNVLLSDERGFDIDLSELWLAICPEVFVAKTAGNLEIALHASNHEQLLVLLRCLRKRVKITGAETGWNEEVASAFRSAFRKDRSFDFRECVFVQVIPDGFGDAVTKADILGHARTAQVQVAVFHPQIFVRELFIQLKGENFRFVQDFDFGDFDLNLAGVDIRIDSAGSIKFGTLGNLSGYLKHVFLPELVAQFGGLGVLLSFEDNLCHPFPVAQIDEDDAGVVAIGIHPTDKCDGLADVLFAQFVAMMGSVHNQ